MSDIVELLKNGDEKGLSILYDNYAASLLGLIVGVVKNKGIGEEILQKTLLKAWNNIHSYDPGKGNFFTWLSKIARNNAIDQVRLKGHQRRRETEPLDISHEGDSSTTIQTEKIDTSALLSSLNDNQRIILDMIYLQGYTHRETAEILEMSLGTVKSRLRLAILTLRDTLKGEKNLFLGIYLLIVFLILKAWA